MGLRAPRRLLADRPAARRARLAAYVAWAVGALVTCAPVWAQAPAAPAQAAPAQAPAPIALRPALIEPLRQAQQLLKDGQFAQAMGILGGTDAVADKTPAETYAIERMRAAAASALGDAPQAARSLQAALDSGQTPAAERPALTEALAGILFNLRQYAPAAQWARRYLELGGSRADMRMVLVQALYFSGDWSGAARESQALAREQQGAGQKPAEALLELWANAQLKLNDEAGYLAALEQLLTLYPKKDYWVDLLIRLERKPGFSPDLRIDLFRLQLAAGAFSDPSEYLDLAQMALQAGHPAEAQAVLAAGFAAGLLGSGAEGDKHRLYQRQIEERVQFQRKSFEPGGTAAEEPASADEAFARGYSLATQGQSALGLTIMQRQLDQGGLREPAHARLHLAYACAQAGDKARARELLRGIPASAADGSADLARLWMLLL